MQSITIEALDMSEREILMVSFHRQSGEWWAVIGDERKDWSRGEAREVGSGATPIAALGELLVRMGAKPETN